MTRFTHCYSSVVVMLLLPLAAPVLAHSIKVSGDVAATFHIEPHHNPKAGEPSQAWFALTHPGGAIIPLAQCDCKLAIHLEPHKEEDAPLLAPSLQPISIEKYQGIPSAAITFPKPGAYEIELSGKPKAGAKFQPFELSYTVIVTTGAASTVIPSTEEIAGKHSHIENSATSQKAISSTRQPSPWLAPLAIGGTIVGIGAVGFMLQRLKKRRP